MEYPIVDLDDSDKNASIERAQWQQHVENRMRLFEERGLLSAKGSIRHIDEEKLFYFLLDVEVHTAQIPDAKSPGQT